MFSEGDLTPEEQDLLLKDPAAFFETIRLWRSASTNMLSELYWTIRPFKKMLDAQLKVLMGDPSAVLRAKAGEGHSRESKDTDDNPDLSDADLARFWQAQEALRQQKEDRETARRQREREVRERQKAEEEEQFSRTLENLRHRKDESGVSRLQQLLASAGLDATATSVAPG